MTGFPFVPSVRSSILPTALIVSLAMQTPARADLNPLLEDVSGKESCMQLMNAGFAGELNRRSAATSTSGVTPDTLWIGFRPGHTGNYWSIGAGPARPFADASGIWTFDDPVHGDSLQGWWPFRRAHTNFSGATLTDEQRPWWAVEYGNVANYVINLRRDPNDPSAPGNRTFGVVGMWHRDPGNTITGTIPGTNPQPPGWTPLAGSYSAWMGIRGHGDLTAQDPITGNYFNASTVEQMTFSTTFGGPGFTVRRLPGYIGNMDQMMYRDIDLSGAPPGTPVSITFLYRTNMSTGKDTDTRFRTGWHEGDPLSTNQATPGNFISAEAGVPANAKAPIDSFQVYIGAPVDDDAWLTSLNDVRSVYDPQRRWFNEILQRDHRRWLFGAAGTNAAQQVKVQLSAQDRDAFLAAAAAAGHPGRLRLVFRVHTNRAFDDGAGSVPNNYNSGYAGAAVVDDVIVDIGAGDVVIGDFEAPDAIDNALVVDPVGAWKSTGKPPDGFAHAHDIATLIYQDICGPVGSPNRLCNMEGGVISLGLHEMGEAATDPTPLSPDHEGFWGVVSPTINFVTSGPANGWGVTGDAIADLDDVYLRYEMYTGYFDVFTQGQLWQPALQSYPQVQSDGTRTWGGIMTPGCLYMNPEKQCFVISDVAYGNGLIHTSNPDGIPDSIRVAWTKLSECYRFGVTTGCSSIDGGYLDNMTVGLVRNAPPPLAQVDIWDLFGDAFPANETPGMPGTAAFDTAAAHIKIGLNVAPTTNDLTRYVVPGDSLTVQASGDSIRLDLMFRIKPGVGNHVTIGNPASGMRQVPTSPAQATSGDGSFWGSYMANPGAFSGPPGMVDPGGATAMHAANPGGWSALVWNSARMDSAEGGGHATFPVQALNIQSPPTGTQWCSNYHETELAGARASLGIPRNRCFVRDTLVSHLNDSNVHCGDPAKGVYPPAWVTTLPASRTGWDGTTTTVEGTKILPDGQLTPGAHVQYFIRRQDLDQPLSVFGMVPDTTVVYPQPGEGNLDGHRWQHFAVLPDRWKDQAFGGLGMACLLFVDGADRRGDERVWKGIADSLGATAQDDVGAADGYGHVPGTGDVNDPQYFIADRNAQFGTLWDAYQVKAGESFTTSAMHIGGRLGYRAAGGPMDGKWTRTPPTPDMLNTYYSLIFFSSGDASYSILGPENDISSDDIALLEDWLTSGDPGGPTRGLLTMGDSFLEAAFLGNGGAPQQAFVSNYLGVTLVDHNYRLFLPDFNDDIPLPMTPAITTGGVEVYLKNTCSAEQDVLAVNSALPEASAASYYASVASGNVSAVYKGHDPARPWVALTTGHRLQHLRTQFGHSGIGRLLWFQEVLTNTFGPICMAVGPPANIDVPQVDGRALADFARLRNNPVRSGYASIAFGLARDDRVEIAVFDVSGRRVRTLAERLFKAGEHELLWDGLDDAGNRAPRGVYFTRVRYAGTGFEKAAKLTILK